MLQRAREFKQKIRELISTSTFSPCTGPTPPVWTGRLGRVTSVLTLVSRIIISKLTYNYIFYPDKAQWSVHGLWPTRYGEINPNFCNNSWAYSHQEMEPIMTELKEFWPDVEMRKVKDSLWQHEWTKHGTCAVASARETKMAGQTDYFSTGCRLARENPLTDWLAKAGVKPDDQTLYETRQVWEAVMAGTGGARPHIDCQKVEGSAMISEIKVCYYKNLTRANCDHIVGDESDLVKSDMLGKCLR